MRRRRHGRFQEEAFEDDQNLGQRDRTDGSHRGKLGQNREYPVGLPERPRRERAKPVEPLAPVGGGGQSAELIDERKGVAAKAERSSSVRPSVAACVSSSSPSSASLRRSSLASPVDPTSPAIAPADHRRLDEKALPAARRPELPVSGNGLVDVGGQDFRLGGHCGLIGSVGRELRDELRIRGNPAVAPRRGLGRCAAGRGVRYLTERQVLGETPRRQAFSGTFQQ